MHSVVSLQMYTAVFLSVAMVVVMHGPVWTQSLDVSCNKYEQSGCKQANKQFNQIIYRCFGKVSTPEISGVLPWGFTNLLCGNLPRSNYFGEYNVIITNKNDGQSITKFK